MRTRKLGPVDTLTLREWKMLKRHGLAMIEDDRYRLKRRKGRGGVLRVCEVSQFGTVAAREAVLPLKAWLVVAWFRTHPGDVTGFIEATGADPQWAWAWTMTLYDHLWPIAAEDNPEIPVSMVPARSDHIDRLGMPFTVADVRNRAMPLLSRKGRASMAAKRPRPSRRKVEGEPWKDEGVSRATWYRRQKALLMIGKQLTL